MNPPSSTARGGVRLRSLLKSHQCGQPLITIITATCNAAGCLGKLADSIRRQTYRNVEWIVIDGASTDGSLDILHRNEDLINYWLSEPDSGIHDAWNKGIRLAQGDWLCFLGADDWLWAPDVLEKLAPVLATVYPAFRVVYGRLAIVNSRGEVLFVTGEAWKKIRKRFKSYGVLPHTGLLHHKSLFSEHGLFDVTYRIAGDYEFLLRELVNREAYFVGDIIIAAQSTGGASKSPDLTGIVLSEIRRANRERGHYLPDVPWLMEKSRYLLRRCLWQIVGERRARIILDISRQVRGKPPYWTRM